MKRSGVNILIQSFLLFILFIALGMVSVALAHFEVVSWSHNKVVYWKVKVSEGQSFKDFHVWTDDLLEFDDAVMPNGWEYGEVEVSDERGWLSFWGSRAIDHDTVFHVEYYGHMSLSSRGKWRITDDGDNDPNDGVCESGKDAVSAIRAGYPTLSQWVLIVLALSVAGFFVWQLKRRKAVISHQ